MPNGIILEYSVELERYEDGSDVDSRVVDKNTFVVQFNDSLNIGKFNVSVVILLHETRIAWTVATICFAMSVSTKLVPAQTYISAIIHMYMCWSVKLGYDLMSPQFNERL